MFYSRTHRVNPAVVAILLFLSPAALALNIETGVGVGLGYTDNAGLTSTNEEDDWLTEASIGATISENTGSFAGRAEALFSYQNYLNDTFGDQNYLSLIAVADWEQIRDRLSWNVQNYFTQTPVNSLSADTPDNTEDTNVFSFGPSIYIQATPSNSFTINPLFQDFYYEDSDTDNQQYGVTTGWMYMMYPTMAVGLNGSVTKVAYDDEDLNPDYTISNIHALLSGTRPRSEYSVGLGWTHINRDVFDNEEGFFGNLDWLYNLTGKSSVRVIALSDLTDSSADLFSSEVDPDTGDSSNVQTSSDIMRNNTLTVTYLREGTTLDTRIWTELRDLDYKESPNDREVQVYGASLDYQVSPLLMTSIGGWYNRTEETDINRTDKEYSIGGNVAYQLSRKLQWSLDVRYRDRDSTLSTEEYDEFSVFAGLVYGSGSLRSFSD